MSARCRRRRLLPDRARREVGRPRDGPSATSPSGERSGAQCKRYAPGELVRSPEVRLLYAGSWSRSPPTLVDTPRRSSGLMPLHS